MAKKKKQFTTDYVENLEEEVKALRELVEKERKTIIEFSKHILNQEQRLAEKDDLCIYWMQKYNKLSEKITLETEKAERKNTVTAKIIAM